MLRAEIVGKRPGFAQFQVRDAPEVKGVLRLQVRRNQGPEFYLGDTGRWQTTPDSWFAIGTENRLPAPAGFDISVGPQIVDPIVASLAGCAFQLVLETASGPATAALTIARSPALLASSAATAETMAPDAAQPVSPQKTLVADPTEAPIASIAEPGQSSGVWRWVLLVVTLLIIALVNLAYRYEVELRQALGLPEPIAPAPVSPAPSAQAPVAAGEIDLKTFITQNPDHKTWGAMAAQKLAACDLNWATTLYRELGENGDPDAAIAMGRIYDPVEHLCPAVQDQQHPMSAETAAFWYQKAVSANSAEATRRLGILWAKAGNDGPHYADGIDLLKRAAESGDAAAAEALKGLGQ